MVVVPALSNDKILCPASAPVLVKFATVSSELDQVIPWLSALDGLIDAPRVTSAPTTPSLALSLFKVTPVT